MRKRVMATAVAAFVASLIVAAAVLSQNKQHEEIAFEESFNYTVHFCPKEECLQELIAVLRTARESVLCAFYRADESVISSVPSAATAEVVIDEKAKAAALNFSSVKIYKSESKGIMHNKYCIIDSARIITGSFNPTAAAANDYNNLLIINSTALAAFYGSNFEKLKMGNSKKAPTTAATATEKTQHKAAILNTTAVEVYFCPEDGCTEAVKEKIRQANHSIIFAAYSFTHPEIANELILKRGEGIAVAGVIEKSTTGSEYSKHAMMEANGINVKLESSKRLMHHKFFIVDNRTVITGSFNPTRNADERNDENLIIVHGSEVAGKYAEEFTRIYGRDYAQK